MIHVPTVVVRGDVLASWLKVSNSTQSQLADALNISRGRVSQLLTSREEPSAHLIAKLIVLTQLPFERLFKVMLRDGDVPPARKPALSMRHRRADRVVA